ncbi:MAG: hypothetical protein ABSE49_31470 [Polyangiaceae bacterium]|jgi:hypothetical protein
MRIAASVVFPLAAFAFACTGEPPDLGEPTEPSPPAAPDAGPSLPEVTLPGTTQPSGAPGLCTSWSSTVLDLSALSIAQPRSFIHGVEGGFSVVATDARTTRVAALAFDATGTSRAPEVDLPLEDTAVSDVVATSEGGWLAVWSDGESAYGACSGDLSFVHYDVGGTPTGQTASQSGAFGALGAEPGGTTDVAWCSSSGSAWSSQMGTVATFPLSLTPGPSFASASQEWWLGWHLGTLLSMDCPDASCNYYGDGVVGALHTWNTTGQSVLDVVLPADLATAMSSGAARASPGEDATTAIVAQASGVSFVSASQVAVVPSDVLLNGASPWSAPAVGGAQRAVVGFDGHIAGEGDAGGSDALEIVEVTSSGVRSVVGQVSLPPDPQRDLSMATVSLTATLAEDAYMVVLVGQTIEGAVFTCTGRSS